MLGVYLNTYRAVHGSVAPRKVALGESEADVIHPARGFMDSFDLTMQLQVGCPGG